MAGKLLKGIMAFFGSGIGTLRAEVSRSVLPRSVYADLLDRGLIETCDSGDPDSVGLALTQAGSDYLDSYSYDPKGN